MEAGHAKTVKLVLEVLASDLVHTEERVRKLRSELEGVPMLSGEQAASLMFMSGVRRFADWMEGNEPKCRSNAVDNLRKIGGWMGWGIYGGAGDESKVENGKSRTVKMEVEVLAADLGRIEEGLRKAQAEFGDKVPTFDREQLASVMFMAGVGSLVGAGEGEDERHRVFVVKELRKMAVLIGWDCSGWASDKVRLKTLNVEIEVTERDLERLMTGYRVVCEHFPGSVEGLAREELAAAALRNGVEGLGGIWSNPDLCPPGSLMGSAMARSGVVPEDLGGLRSGVAARHGMKSVRMEIAVRESDIEGLLASYRLVCERYPGCVDGLSREELLGAAFADGLAQLHAFWGSGDHWVIGFAQVNLIGALRDLGWDG